MSGAFSNCLLLGRRAGGLARGRLVLVAKLVANTAGLPLAYQLAAAVSVAIGTTCTL